jgi:hypothetical protein
LAPVGACLESVASRNPVGIIPANRREVERVTSWFMVGPVVSTVNNKSVHFDTTLRFGSTVAYKVSTQGKKKKNVEIEEIS